MVRYLFALEHFPKSVNEIFCAKPASTFVKIALSLIFSLFIGKGLAQDIPPKQDWSFSGPFGLYDKAQLQRGLKVYKEVCSSCHALKFVAFRDLTALGYTEEEIRVFAAEYQIEDGPNGQGEMFTRPGQSSDYFPAPFANEQLAAFANNGALPVDLSLIARARDGARPFPGFLADLFTNYSAAGSDYIYALLTGYGLPPAGQELPDGLYYNSHFISGSMTAMAPPLYEDSVTYEDGTAQSVDNYARDVAAFLMWAADPHMELRKKAGFRVLVFLVIFSTLLYLVKRRIWTR